MMSYEATNFSLSIRTIRVTAEFYNGSNELAEDELRLAAIFLQKGRKDLANCVLNGRKIQRFYFGLGLESCFLHIGTFLPYRDISTPVQETSACLQLGR